MSVSSSCNTRCCFIFVIASVQKRYRHVARSHTMIVALRRIIYTLSLYEFDSVGSYVCTRRFAIILVLVAVKLTLLFHAKKYIPVHLQNMIIIYIEVLSTIHTPIISWFERVTHSDSSRPSTRSIVIRNTFQARYQKISGCSCSVICHPLPSSPSAHSFANPFDRTMSICVHKSVVSFHGRT